MESGLKIVSFEAKNLRKIDEIMINPKESGLTLIGGSNDAGKTTIIEAIANALANKFTALSNMKKKYSLSKQEVEIVLSNGWKLKLLSSKIKLETNDEVLQKSPTEILTTIFSEFALNIPKFIGLTDIMKVKYLLKSFGLDKELDKLEKEAIEIKSDRDAKHLTKQSKAKALENSVYIDGLPTEETSTREILASRKALLLQDAKNTELKAKPILLEGELANLKDSLVNKQNVLNDLKAKVTEAESAVITAVENIHAKESEIEISKKTSAELEEVSTEQLELDLENINDNNAKIVKNREYLILKDELNNATLEHRKVDSKFKENYLAQTKLLSVVTEKIEKVTIENNVIHFDGFNFDELSTSKQIQVSIKLLHAINPDDRIILLDRLESLDETQELLIDNLCKELDLQAWGTKVSRSNDETCDLIFENGKVIVNRLAKATEAIEAEIVEEKAVKPEDLGY